MYLNELKEIKEKLATSELERQTLNSKLKQKNKQIATFTEDITRKEVELIKTKQQLGEALNENNEIANQNLNYFRILSQTP